MFDVLLGRGKGNANERRGHHSPPGHRRPLRFAERCLAQVPPLGTGGGLLSEAECRRALRFVADGERETATAAELRSVDQGAGGRKQFH